MTAKNPFVQFVLVLLFGINLRVVVQCINLLAQDESLSPVSVWKFYVLKALILGSYHQTFLVSAELLGVSIILCAYAPEIVNKPVIFLFTFPSYLFTIGIYVFLPNRCFVFFNVLLLLHAFSLYTLYLFIYLALIFDLASPSFHFVLLNSCQLLQCFTVDRIWRFRSFYWLPWKDFCHFIFEEQYGQNCARGDSHK